MQRRKRPLWAQQRRPCGAWRCGVRRRRPLARSASRWPADDAARALHWHIEQHLNSSKGMANELALCVLGWLAGCVCMLRARALIVRAAHA